MTTTSDILLTAIGKEYRSVCVAAADAATNTDYPTIAARRSHARIYRNHAARCARAMAYLRCRIGRQAHARYGDGPLDLDHEECGHCEPETPAHAATTDAF